MNGMATRRTGPVTAGAAARPAPTPVRRIAALRAAGRWKGAPSAGRATAPRGATRPTTVCAFMNNRGLGETETADGGKLERRSFHVETERKAEHVDLDALLPSDQDAGQPEE